MTTHYLTISASSSDPYVIAGLIGEDGLFAHTGRVLAECEGVDSSSISSFTTGDRTEPDVSSKIQSLIDYLGEAAALKALEGGASIYDYDLVAGDSA